MATARVLLTVLIALPCTASSLQRPGHAKILDSPEIVLELAAMIDDSLRGPRETEIAAFLVLDEYGDLGLVRWQNSAKSRAQSFTGVVPAATVGIVHTHPNGWARPSSGDRREAKRTGLPIYVLTRWDIWVAGPAGEVVPLVERQDWPDQLLISQEDLPAGNEHGIVSP